MSKGKTGRVIGSAGQMAGSGAAIGTMIAPGVGTAVGAVGGGLIGLVTSLIGEAEAEGDFAKAEALREQAFKLMEQVQSPGEFQFSPNTVGASAFEGVSQDPVTSARIQKLIADIEGQANAADDPMQQQAYAKAFRQADRQSYNQMQDALAASRQRGVMGSGAELGALLGANERGADAVADASMGAASDLYRRRFDALRASLGANQNERNTALGLASDKANAKDRISQFNAGQSWNAQIHQAQQRQTNYENQLRQTQMKIDAMNGRASGAANNAAMSIGGTNAALQGIASGAASIAPYFNKTSSPAVSRMSAVDVANVQPSQESNDWATYNANKYKNAWGK